jgi:Uma2 family endonuclease
METLTPRRQRRIRKTPEARMTLMQYFDTPETALPQELAYGAHAVADAPSPSHQRLVGQLFLALHRHLEKHLVGEVWVAPLDIVLDPEAPIVVQPDLCVIASERDDIVQDRVYGAPDLMIEVLSPRPRIGDVERRLGWFARYGVRECWIVHQIDRQVDIVSFQSGRIVERRSFPGDAILTSRVLPDARLSLDDIDGGGRLSARF